MLSEDLSEIERDALTELVNIAVSGAASRLRVMIGSEVSLTVPIIDVLSAEHASRSMADLGLNQLLAVRQAFEGRLSGQTMLIFSESDARILSTAVLGQELSEQELLDLQADALGEIGNVLLLGLLATIGSMLGLTFEVAIPIVEPALAEDVFPTDRERIIMLIHVNFSVRQIDARGYFALVLGLGSFAALREVLDTFLRDLLN